MQELQPLHTRLIVAAQAALEAEERAAQAISNQEAQERINSRAPMVNSQNGRKIRQKKAWRSGFEMTKRQGEEPLSAFSALRAAATLREIAPQSRRARRRE